MKRLYLREIAIRICLVMGGIALVLFLGEFLLRGIDLYKGRYINYYVWRPYLKKAFIPAKGVMPGINGRKLFFTNSLGIRGDEVTKKQNYHILVVGGSAAECLYLDNSEAWPYLTQKILNEKGYKVWIGNIGKSAMKIADHTKDIEALLKQFPFIDSIIVLAGINDAQSAFNHPSDIEEDRNADEKRPFYKDIALWKWSAKLRRKYVIDKSMVLNQAGTTYDIYRKNRKDGVMIDSAPDLTKDLFQYKVELNRLIDIAKRRGVRVIFMIQPTIWRERLTEKEKELLWFGWKGENQANSKEYYSLRVLAKAMDMFNSTLLNVCRDRKVECIDLAGFLPKDFTIFYDDCHFNENGSAAVADILATYLADEAPVKLPPPLSPKNWKKP